MALRYIAHETICEHIGRITFLTAEEMAALRPYFEWQPQPNIRLLLCRNCTAALRDALDRHGDNEPDEDK